MELYVCDFIQTSKYSFSHQANFNLLPKQPKGSGSLSFSVNQNHRVQNYLVVASKVYHQDWWVPL